MQPSQPQTTGQQQAPTLNLTDFSIDEVNIIIMGLVKLPYETSAPVVEKVRAQAQTQLQVVQQTTRPDGISVNTQ
jgi:hypothetical protein